MMSSAIPVRANWTSGHRGLAWGVEHLQAEKRLERGRSHSGSRSN